MTGKTDAFLLSGKDCMGVFDEVKERVTAREVMERAGMHSMPKSRTHLRLKLRSWKRLLPATSKARNQRRNL